MKNGRDKEEFVLGLINTLEYAGVKTLHEMYDLIQPHLTESITIKDVKDQVHKIVLPVTLCYSSFQRMVTQRFIQGNLIYSNSVSLKNSGCRKPMYLISKHRKKVKNENRKAKG